MDHDDSFSMRHLVAFMAVMKTGKVVSASRRLRRSASAISRSVTVLEETLGCALVLRDPAGFTPTREGKLVAARCRLILAELDDLKEHLRRSDNAGRLRDNASLFRMDINLSRLMALANVHDLRSVQRASQKMGISQPAISTSIRYLETDLGIDLFSRTLKGMVANPAGMAVAVTAKRVLSEIRKIRDDLASVGGMLSGLVCVGGLAYSRSTILPITIQRVLRELPGVVVRTVEGPLDVLLVAMHAGDIDVIICARPDASLLEGIEVEPVVDDPVGFFVSKDHPVAVKQGVSAAELLSYPFILPPQGSATRDLLDRTLQARTGRLPQGALETSSSSIIRNMLISSDHISFRSVSEFQGDLDGNRICQVALDFPLPHRFICLLQRKGGKRTSAVEAFLERAREAAQLFQE